MRIILNLISFSSVGAIAVRVSVLLMMAVTAATLLPGLWRVARADEFTVYSPIVEPGERELELKAASEWDAGQRAAHEDTGTLAVGWGLTPRWFSEVELEWQRPPGGALRRSTTEWENVVQLTPQGKYWLDAGLFAELEAPAQSGQPGTLELGPLLQKQSGHLLTTVNLRAATQYGSNAVPGAHGEYAWQVRWLRARGPEPGLEGFGEPHEQRAGPVLTGRVRLGGARTLRYELGYLAALSASTPDHTLKAKVELEF